MRALDRGYSAVSSLGMWGEGTVYTASGGPASYQGPRMSELHRKGSVLGRGGSPEETAEHRRRLGHGRDYCRGFQVLCSLHGPLINIHRRLCVFKMWRSGLPPASVGKRPWHGTCGVAIPTVVTRVSVPY